MEQRVRVRLSLDDFIELFICALVVRGKTRICRRGKHFDEEDRPGLETVRQYLVTLYEGLDKNTAKEYKYSVVNIRNLFSRGTYGSFEAFFHLIFSKPHLLKEFRVYDEFYTFIYDRTSAQELLDATSKEMREIVDKVADAYVSAKK